MTPDVHVERWNGGVVYIDIAAFGLRRRLQGMDHYWIDWPRYGMYCTETRFGPEYASGCVAYELTPNGEIDLGRMMPPEGVEIMDGIMLPDELAREYGLL